MAAFGARLRAMRASRYGAFLPVALAIASIWLYFGLTEPAFFSARNMYFLLLQSAIVGTLAVGITYVLLLGDIDLSVAALSGVCAAVLGVLVTNMGVPAWAACIAAIAAGVSLGMLQGTLVAYIGIPSFVVTLAGLLGFQGLMLKILGVQGAINVRDPYIRGLTTETLSPGAGWLLAAACTAAAAWLAWRWRRRRAALDLDLESTWAPVGRVALFALCAFAAVAALNAYRGVPLVVVLLLALTVILGWVTTSTPFGRALFAVGGNAESARRVGISIQGMRVAAFGVVGFMAAVASIIGASRYASVSFNAFAGGPLLLNAIGAAVIGGTSLFGGLGSVWNAILGALVIGSLGNGLDLSGAGAAEKLMISGLILLIAVAIDAITRGGPVRGR